jgi:hypothetical protein
MSHNNKVFVMTYALLVVLPVGGLLAILKHGRTLRAPVSVSGAWTLHAAATPSASLVCARSLVDADTGVVISQSGQDITLTWSDAERTTTSGVINGTTLTATVPRSKAGANEGGCAGSRLLSLAATLDAPEKPRSFSGTLATTECPDCAPVAITGSKQDDAGKGGR